jgi:hypothetical protein
MLSYPKGVRKYPMTKCLQPTTKTSDTPRETYELSMHMVAFLSFQYSPQATPSEILQSYMLARRFDLPE